MGRRLGPRFGAEAGLIAAAAALATLLEVDWPGIVLIVFGTWLAIAVFEVARSRTHRAVAVGSAPIELEAHATPPPARVASEPPPSPSMPRPPAVEPPPQSGEQSPPASGRPRSWNLWELERAARDRAGVDPAADEERQYMLLYLRNFASPDGELPIDFDPLVRDVFGEMPAVPS